MECYQLLQYLVPKRGEEGIVCAGVSLACSYQFTGTDEGSEFRGRHHVLPLSHAELQGRGYVMLTQTPPLTSLHLQ